MIHYLIWALVAALYVPIFTKLYRVRWDLLDYSHAFFILPIFLWLIWRKRNEIRKLAAYSRAGLNLPGLIGILIGIFMFLVGSRFDYSSVITLSILPLVSGLIYFLYGTAILKLLTFPLLYLLLLVPPPMGIIDSITLPMRYGISDLAQKILSLLQFPIKRNGLLLTIGYNDIFMGQPCSGFRSLITLFSLGLVYVYLSSSTIPKKIILTISIVPLALLGNLVRVMALCLITFYFGEEVGQGFFHNFSGIVMFIITVLGLIGIESIMGKWNHTAK